MANSRFPLTIKAHDTLGRVMVELDLDLKKRSEALKIALAKGLAESTGAPPEVTGPNSDFTVGAGVLVRDEEYTMYKHLIIERIGIKIEDKEIDKYLQRYLEYGLECMDREMSQLTDLDNYLLMLIEN